jgi:cytochrome b subunit of formate dehydrogenase
MFVSTVLLVITGFMLQADQGFIDLFGEYAQPVFWVRSILHRVAGVAIIAVCIYHLYYVATTEEGRSWLVDMVPRVRDGVDLVQNMMFMMGFRKDRPKFGRFFYMEKIEYWSVYIGMFLVISTGVIMWTEWLWPKFILDVSGAFHLGEATLAAAAIIVGHIFAVHFDPHVYPMNRAFIDGMISEDLMKEEHGEWYEEEMAKLTSTKDGDSSNV